MTFSIDLSGRTALVTGGGQGVGRGTALALASAGAAVLVNDYVPERAEAVASEILAAQGRAEPVPFDVSDYDAVTRAVRSGPGVDVLVNNAGNAGPAGFTSPSVSSGLFAESEPADWDKYFAVNLFGVMHCTRAVLPHMIEQGHGRVITIISDAARWGEARMAPYSAAKGGAASFTRALAREVGRNGITVNNVALATIDTIGLADQAESSPEVAERLRRQLQRYVVRRLGTPDDVSGLVTFLASELASWITGQTYPVNGGYTVNQ